MIKKYGYLFTFLLGINSASYGFLKPFQHMGALAATKCLKQTRNHFTAHAAWFKKDDYGDCKNMTIKGDGTIICNGKVINKPSNSDSPSQVVIVNGHIQRIISSETKSLDQVKLTTQTPFTLDVQNLISGNISLTTHDSNQLVINGTAVSYDKEALNKMGYTATESDSYNTKVISIATYDNSPTQNPWGMTEQKDGVITHFGPYFAGNSNSINLNILVPAACNQFFIKSN